MLRLVVLLLLNLLLVVPQSRAATHSPVPHTLPEQRCGQPVIGGEEAVVGPYPLQVIVAEIDYENATIDFLTEMKTTLHVRQASANQLKQLQVGDTVEICIVEALRGEEEV